MKNAGEIATATRPGGTTSRALRALRVSADPREVDEGEGGQDGEDERLCAVEPEPQLRRAAPDDVADHIARPHEGEEDQQTDAVRHDARPNRLREEGGGAQHHV